MKGVYDAQRWRDMLQAMLMFIVFAAFFFFRMIFRRCGCFFAAFRTPFAVTRLFSSSFFAACCFCYMLRLRWLRLIYGFSPFADYLPLRFRWLLSAAAAIDIVDVCLFSPLITLLFRGDFSLAATCLFLF